MALQGRVTDLVARREILAARIRKRLTEGKFDDAELLLDEYRGLQSRDELIKDVDAQQGRIADNDAAVDKLTRIAGSKGPTFREKPAAAKPKGPRPIRVPKRVGPPKPAPAPEPALASEPALAPGPATAAKESGMR